MEIFDNAVRQNNVSAYCQLFVNTMANGLELRPRGALIKEIRDAQITLDPRWPFQGFKNRKYNLAYFKAEMRWKLGANKYDDSIKALAKMWESVQNPDKTFNSNYGQYWFGQQMGLMKAVLELIRDKDSRRASIPMLTDAHLHSLNTHMNKEIDRLTRTFSQAAHDMRERERRQGVFLTRNRDPYLSDWLRPPSGLGGTAA